MGLHPNCWSLKTLKLIGEKWGKILQVEHEYSGINSLTSARILIRTYIQQRIEECLRVEWQSGACNVWVSETGRCECISRSVKIKNGSLLSEPSETIVLTEVKEPGNEAGGMRVYNDADGIGLQNVDFEIQRRGGRVSRGKCRGW